MTESQCSYRSLSLAQRTSVCSNLPRKSAVLQFILSVITKFYLCFECFIIRIYSFGKRSNGTTGAQNSRNSSPVRMPLLSQNALSSPTSAVPCPGKSCRSSNWNPLIPDVFKARSYLYFLVKWRLIFRKPAGIEELCLSILFLQVFFHCHEIQRHQSSRIFRNFRKIRIDRILSYFMGYQRHFHTVYRCTEIFIE